MSGIAPPVRSTKWRLLAHALSIRRRAPRERSEIMKTRSRKEDEPGSDRDIMSEVGARRQGPTRHFVAATLVLGMGLLGAGCSGSGSAGGSSTATATATIAPPPPPPPPPGIPFSSV